MSPRKTAASAATEAPAVVQAAVQAAIEQEVDRTKFLGGSDIGAVLGFQPFGRTLVDVWADKTTPRTEDTANRKSKRRGHRWESVVAEMLVESLHEEGHSVEIVAANQRYQDPEIPYFACEIDFEIKLNGEEDITNVELKTVHPFKAKEWGESGDASRVPPYYEAQGMWGLGITRRRRTIIAALFGADELRPFLQVAEQDVISAMRQVGQEFWEQHVLLNVPPEPINYEDLKKIYKGIEGTVLDADDELTEMLLKLREVSSQIDVANRAWDLLQYQIAKRMGVNEVVMVRGKKALTWKSQPWQTIDQELLKKEHKEAYKACLRKGEARQFRLSNFAWEL